jgi:hypothetical protein
MSGRDVLRIIYLGYMLSSSSSHLTSSRDVLYMIYLGGYIILVLNGLLLVIFAIATVYILCISRVRSTGV